MMCKPPITQRFTVLTSALTVALLLVLSVIAQAYQADAPFLALQQRNARAWAAEDQQINAKLVALEKNVRQETQHHLHPGG